MPAHGLAIDRRVRPRRDVMLIPGREICSRAEPGWLSLLAAWSGLTGPSAGPGLARACICLGDQGRSALSISAVAWMASTRSSRLVMLTRVMASTALIRKMPMRRITAADGIWWPDRLAGSMLCRINRVAVSLGFVAPLCRAWWGWPGVAVLVASGGGELRCGTVASLGGRAGCGRRPRSRRAGQRADDGAGAAGGFCGW